MTQLIPHSWQQALGHSRDHMHRAIDRWWQRHPPAAESGQREVMHRDGTFWAPSLPFRGTPGCNVEETDDQLIVTTDGPELKLEDYTVEISGARLVIRGEQRQPSAQHGCGYYDDEQSYGTFMRIVPLPCKVDAEHAQAHYTNGILRVTLPKTARAETRRVQVQVRG